MPRFKRSLHGSGGARPPPSPQPCRIPKLLHEGFAIPPGRGEASTSSSLIPALLPGESSAGLGTGLPSNPATPAIGEVGEPLPYSRGSAAAALKAAQDPKSCAAFLWQGACASTTTGPNKSRASLWEALSHKAGFPEPFRLTPDLIYAVMGALKMAQYRSADQYLEVAKAQHIARGHPWTDQLALARRLAIRSCKRGLGNPKQAGGLPLAKLGPLSGLREPVAPHGPLWPARATLLASWWLLREIEAANARTQHVQVHEVEGKVTWRLPSSKTDQAALGAYRSHRCSCAFAPREICPVHLMMDHLANLELGNPVLFPDNTGQPASKQGWADTFQALAGQLGLPVSHPNGARRFTGHSARVTGARHLAATNTELWRVQLFGRWGSEVFIHYIQDAPLEQLDSLALESSAKLSIEQAKAELQNLLRQVPQHPHPVIASSPAEMIEDCAVPLEVAEESDLSGHCPSIVWNTNNGGKIHRPLDNTGHPRSWRTRCGWRFGLAHAEFEWRSMEQLGEFKSSQRCHRCFPALHFPPPSASSSSSSSSSSA